MPDVFAVSFQSRRWWLFQPLWPHGFGWSHFDFVQSQTTFSL
jgi:hypothetical protein